MVYYMDGVVGEMVELLNKKDMWANTLWVHQSDNGGVSTQSNPPVAHVHF